MERVSEQTVGGFHFREIAGSVHIEAQGDVVAGDKKIIQNIRNVYQIHLASNPLAKAPYKFLAFYDIPDRDIFFGRGDAIRALEELVPRHRIVIVSGASGAGKSSLLNAGLIPKLADSGYDYIRFRDYTDPSRQLSDYLRNSSELDFEGKMPTTVSSLFRFTRDRQGGRAVVILDQFERFLLSVPEAAKEQFIYDLATCLDGSFTANEVNIVIAIRQEFLGRLLSVFDEAIRNFSSESHTYHLRSLRIREAREAIISPLGKVSYRIHFEEAFVDTLLLPHLIGQSPEGDRIEPAPLQIVCNRLYEVAQEQLASGLQGVQIGQPLYNGLGGADGILQGYLEKVVERVSQGDLDQVKVVRSILKLMIQSEGTRRFVSLSDITRALPDLSDDKQPRP